MSTTSRAKRPPALEPRDANELPAGPPDTHWRTDCWIPTLEP